MTLRTTLLLAVAALAAAPAAAPAQPAPAEPAPGDTVLSDEATLSRWAHPVQRAAVLAAPEPGAVRVGRLRLVTGEGRPEVILALRERRDAHGVAWALVRLPGRPNGRTGWVPRSKLGAWHRVETQLRITLRTRSAVLLRRGRPIWSSGVGVGRPGTPTPRGRFWVRERIRNLAGSPVYGPLAFGTSAYSVLSDWPGGGVVGIHGTDRPDLLPGRVSHGCVRVPNGAVRRLAQLMPIGTPVWIR